MNLTFVSQDHFNINCMTFLQYLSNCLTDRIPGWKGHGE